LDVETAPLNHTIKIQLDVLGRGETQLVGTPMCKGTAPNEYQMKAVIPAQVAAQLSCRIGFLGVN
jgi:hypothetical protein